MTTYIDYAKIRIDAVLARFGAMTRSDRGLTTVEVSLITVGLAVVAIILIVAITNAVENNVANIPDHTELP